jgi:cysteine dioxygenase
MNRLFQNIIKTNKLSESIKIVENYTYDDWKYYINFNEENYKKNLVFRNKYIEAFVVCWLPGQKTKIHNHSENGCIFKILEGNMEEIKYDSKNLKILTKNKVIKNDIRYIDNSIGLHKMINNDEKTVSLHIYSPPYFKPTVF